ncbi:hypothetical protein VI06_03310 [Aquitalea magnusonii]|nr:hypothetical protein VI06_03310 [Aquitalea magnusonii]
MNERTYGKYGLTLDQVREAIPSMGVSFQTAITEILQELEQQQAGQLTRKATMAAIQTAIWSLESIQKSERCLARLEGLAERLNSHGFRAQGSTDSRGNNLTLCVDPGGKDATVLSIISHDHQISSGFAFAGNWRLIHCDLYPNALPIRLITE